MEANSSEALLAWPTTGLRETLRESVLGMAANAAAYGHHPQIAIIYDSESEGAEERVRSVGAEASSVYGLEVITIGPRERARLVSQVLPEFHPEVIETALVQRTIPPHHRNSATSHNVARLLSGGRVLISTDDDVFAQPAVLPGAKDPWKSVSGDDSYLPAPLSFYPSRERCVASVAGVDLDIVGEHKRLLGMSWESASKSARDAPVLTTTTGAFGNSGMRTARTMLQLNEEDRARAFDSDESYNAIKLSTEMVRIPESTRVGRGTHLMAMQIGVWNEAPMPPLFPFGRNSDGLSSVMTRVMAPSSVTAFLGFGLLHAPAAPRGYSEEDLVGLRPVPSDFVMGLVVAHRPHQSVTDADERIREIGDGLEYASGLSTDEFSEYVHEIWSNSYEKYVSDLQASLERYRHRPESWARDVQAHIGRTTELLADPEHLLGPDGCGSSAGEVRAMVGAYSKVVKAWPDLRKWWSEQIESFGGIAEML